MLGLDRGESGVVRNEKSCPRLHGGPHAARVTATLNASRLNLEKIAMKRIVVACLTAMLMCSACSVLDQECWDDDYNAEGERCGG